MSEPHSQIPSPATSDDAVRPFSIWAAILQSLKGENHDYTSLPLKRAVLLLAVPMVLEMLMESLFAVVDVYWATRLGSHAVAVVGVTESVMTVIYAVAIGVSVAASAIVARRIGEKDPERASHAAAQILLIGIGLSAAIGLVFALAAPAILRLMRAEPAVVELGTDFARIMFGGNATVFLIFLLNAIFRGAGDAVIAMRTLWLANGLNILLGPLFIFGWGPVPAMGVTGAAVATTIGRGIGVLYQLWHLTGNRSRIRVRWDHLKPDLDLMGTVLKTAKNGVAQFVISTTSWMGVFNILGLAGSSAVAGYTIAIRIVIFALMPAWGLANAGATLVGQNLGAGQPERAAEAVRIASRFNTIFLGGVGLAFIAFSGPIVGIFDPEPEVYRFAVQALWIVSLGFPLYAAGMCLEGAFNGAGDTWTPTRLNFFCFWLGQVPLAWILAQPLGLGATGVFIAVPVSFSVLAIWSHVLFRRGQWKLKRI